MRLKMTKNIKEWLNNQNKEIDRMLDIVIMSMFDNLLVKPLRNAMVYEMKKAEHECRVNLLVYERVQRDLTHDESACPQSHDTPL